MPEPLSSGYLGRWLAAQTIRGDVAIGATLTTLALAVEAKAKENASNGQHQRGTKTPASPGSGPAVITGDLRRAITHTPVSVVGGFLETRVGVASTPHSGPGSANSGQIGRYLEKDGRGSSRYPFLGPAFDEVVRGKVEVTARAAWAAHQVRL